MDYPLGNKYVFDYELVVKEDPTFEKFIEHYQEPEMGMYHMNRSSPIPATTEEHDIIDFVHDKDDQTETGILPRGQAQEACYDDWGEEDSPAPQIEVKLKEEYKDPPNPNYDPTILQLLPPNRFLKGESRIWMGDDTLYSFIDPSSPYGPIRRKFITTIHKYRFSHYPPFVRLIEAIYWFDRAKNAMSEKKVKFRSLVYNTKTRRLYLLRRMKGKSLKRGSRVVKMINNVSNTILTFSWNAGYPERILDKFINTITEIVIKDIGEVFIFPYDSFPLYSVTKRLSERSESEIQKLRLAATILQHRVGQPLKWLTYLLANNIFRIIGDHQFYSKSDKCRTDEVQKIRRKTVFKLIPNLRKSNHMKMAVKTLFAEDYSKLVSKLFNMAPIDGGSLDIHFLINWIFCTRHGLISKELHHWLAQTVNSNNTLLLYNVIGAINPLLQHWRFTTHSHPEEHPTAKSYIKICKKWVGPDGGDAPNWHTWMDMYRMADQLHIRIRPNKLRDAGEVVEIHERLTDIIRRDEDILMKYKDIIFEKFISPDKKYNGFQFVQLRTAEELNEEGTMMHHCVGSYTGSCAQGESIIFSMRKDGKSYVTIELGSRSYAIIQQYTLHDISVTSEEVLDLINRWHGDCMKLHEDDKKSYSDLCCERMEKLTLIGRLRRLCEGGGMINAPALQ